MQSTKKEIENRLANIRQRLSCREGVIAAIRSGNMRAVIEALSKSFDDANFALEYAWLNNEPDKLLDKVRENSQATKFSVVLSNKTPTFYSSEKVALVASLKEQIYETQSSCSKFIYEDEIWLMQIALDADQLIIAKYLAQIYSAHFANIKLHRVLDDPMAQSIMREKIDFFNVFKSCCSRPIWQWLLLNNSRLPKEEVIEKILALRWVDVNTIENEKTPLQLLVDIALILGDAAKKIFVCLIRNKADFNVLSADEKTQLLPMIKYPSEKVDVLEEMIKLDQVEICQFMIDGDTKIEVQHYRAAMDNPHILTMLDDKRQSGFKIL